ncbi:MAG: SPW repeat protein [Bryobacteraceae bacterium]
MAPNEPTYSSTSMESPARLRGVRTASTIVLLAGIWFFVSPWVYGAYLHPSAWNSWIIGAIMFILGCTRVGRPSHLTALSWCNMVLGIWAFISPWVYGYTDSTGRLINSLCVGVIVFVFSIVSSTLAARTNAVRVSHV